ncbi:hypothetical protein SASPL_118558 [Salvia splendens]|uniref:Myb/SANT-like domain-containing protein n=1 Tax=Salvia splendens TaxID=180675 RepID=A0A8X8ZXC4_SALSN|nr:hypothetical protein SASPL_118558 [Salvia splendens]
MDIPPQAIFFFKGKWSVELDNQLLCELVRVKEEHGDLHSGLPDEALVAARVKVEAMAANKFSVDELHTRVHFLASRYKTFHMLVSTPGVWWYPNMNVVDAADTVWRKVMKEYPLSAAYYHEDEPEYRRLTSVFGPLDVKQEGSDELNVAVPKEVIVLSDTTIPQHEVIDLTVVESPFLQEVNSPAVVIGEKVKRKLFDDEVESSDRESSNKPPTVFYVPGPRGKAIMKMPPPRSLPVNLHVPTRTASPDGSSEASNSPNPRARNIDGYAKGGTVVAAAGDNSVARDVGLFESEMVIRILHN